MFLMIIIIIMRSLSTPSQLSPRRIQQTKRRKVPGTKKLDAAHTNVSLTSPSINLYTHTHTTHTQAHTQLKKPYTNTVSQIIL